MPPQRTASRAALLAVEIDITGEHAVVTLRGQADASTHERLCAELGELPLGQVRLVELQLSELEFCDVASAREIIDLADGVRTHGGRLQVTGAPNVWVHTMLTILDVAGDLPLDGTTPNG